MLARTPTEAVHEVAIWALPAEVMITGEDAVGKYKKFVFCAKFVEESWPWVNWPVLEKYWKFEDEDCPPSIIPVTGFSSSKFVLEKALETENNPSHKNRNEINNMICFCFCVGCFLIINAVLLYHLKVTIIHYYDFFSVVDSFVGEDFAVFDDPILSGATSIILFIVGL